MENFGGGLRIFWRKYKAERAFWFGSSYQGVEGGNANKLVERLSLVRLEVLISECGLR